VGGVERRRGIDGKIHIEPSEFICSFANLEKFSRVEGIGENQQHYWLLDIHFEEDKSRTHTEFVPENP
jgi:hypothetical protein